jgi:exosortase/archaeosortase family protein
VPGNSAAPTSPSRRADWFYAWALLILTVVVFWPAVRWLTSQAFAREQLKQSFILVVFAGGWIAWEKRHALRVNLRVSNTTLIWLFASYLLAAGARYFNQPLLFLAGLVAAAGGMVNYIFGGQAFRRTLPLLSVFAFLILCVLLFPVLDWPLRQMAGIESAQLLKAVGLAPELGITRTYPPSLVLRTDSVHSFVVATECNGFGLITSSVLLGMIRLLYRRAPWWSFGLLLPFCVAVGFVFNFLRITTIVLLAPLVPDHYHVMHETAGLIALYSGLGFVWYLTGTDRPRPKVAA